MTIYAKIEIRKIWEGLMENKKFTRVDAFFLPIIIILVTLNILVFFKSRRFLEVELLVDRNKKSQVYADMHGIQLENFVKPKSLTDFNMARNPITPYRQKHFEDAPKYHNFLRVELGDREAIIALDGMFIWPDH